MNAALARRHAAGLTLIELMVVLAVASVLVVLAAPSFKRIIDLQRLRGINAELVTDLQFARAEAASRNRYVWVRFGGTPQLTCYVIVDGDPTACNCGAPAGTPVCAVLSGALAIRTVQVPRATGITVSLAQNQTLTTMGFDPATGRLLSIPLDTAQPAIAPFRLQVRHEDLGGFIDAVELTGRPTVCSPSAQISGVPSCS